MPKENDLSVAKREKTVKSICENNLIYQDILETSTDGFIFVNKNGYIIYINKAYYEFLGFKTKEEVIGKYILDVIKNSELIDILLTGRTDVDVYQYVEGQNVKKSVVAVTRTVVTDGDQVIAAVGQVKFSKETKLLAEKFQDIDNKSKYFRGELKRRETGYTFESMIGSSPKFLEAKAVAKKAAENDFSVLITGETGVGKEVFATAIHNASDRSTKPFIQINCAAIPNELLESELFGYEEGSFTGAKKGGKPGKFEMANGGTLFLDEVGELPLSMQVKLLRVLQEKEVERIGGLQPKPIDVRILAATNQNLDVSMRNHTFRPDLYYRLNVIPVKIPPLRERSEDIQFFINVFMDELYQHFGIKKHIASSAWRLLQQYDWPGNIRELKNVIQRAYAISDSDKILDEHLPANIVGKVHTNKFLSDYKSLDNILNEIEKEILLNCLRENDYNCRMTAKELGIHRSTLYKKFKKFNMDIIRNN